MHTYAFMALISGEMATVEAENVQEAKEWFKRTYPGAIYSYVYEKWVYRCGED